MLKSLSELSYIYLFSRDKLPLSFVQVLLEIANVLMMEVSQLAIALPDAMMVLSLKHFICI